MVSYFTTAVPADTPVASRRRLDLDIKFAFDSAELSTDGVEQLDVAGEALNDPRLAQHVFMLAGHTDDRGDETYNRALSLRRAQSTRRYLIEKHGVDADRLQTAGFGSEHPRLGGATNDARKMNRRVVLEMIQ